MTAKINSIHIKKPIDGSLVGMGVGFRLGFREGTLKQKQSKITENESMTQNIFDVDVLYLPMEDE